VGGGPAGAVTALHLLAAGLKPVIVEKETFPRYHIGESLTGECGACLRELGLEEQMAAIGWPIKHGVTVYGAGAQNSFWVPVKKRNAQHELETTSTWQVRRSDFDKMLLDTAIARGAQHLHAKALSPIVEETGKVSGLVYEADDGSTQSLQCKVLVDASGQAGFLANRSTLTSGKERGRYDSQIAVFTQVRNAKRDIGDAAGNTLIFVGKPYQWAWFIPLDEHTTSVGVVVPREYFRARAGSPEDFLRGEFLGLNPELARRLADAELYRRWLSLRRGCASVH
jgi:flavin-dependent dehydrogenase